MAAAADIGHSDEVDSDRAEVEVDDDPDHPAAVGMEAMAEAMADLLEMRQEDEISEEDFEIAKQQLLQKLAGHASQP